MRIRRFCRARRSRSTAAPREGGPGRGAAPRPPPWRCTRFLRVLAIAAGLFWSAAAAAAPAEEDYGWKQIPIGGGGYVTGIVLHPTEPDLAYIRTDIGGAYRWSEAPDEEGRHWSPISDHFTLDDSNFYGIESIAVDPSDPDAVYMAAGKYDWAGPGEVFRSTDRGKSWSATGLRLMMHGAGRLRWAGERLAVDPRDGNVVYFGSREDGLWRSTDRARSWSRIAGFPTQGKPAIGIVFVVFGGNPGLMTGASRIYAAAFGDGLYLSDDAGASWQSIGGPDEPVRGAVGSDGVLFVTSTSGVHKYDGVTWTDISPAAGREYGGLSVDPTDPKTLVVAERSDTYHLPMYRSADGGSTWTVYTSWNGRIALEPNVPWWPDRAFSASTSALAIDPRDPKRVWMTDWYGIWRTPDITARPSIWRTFEQGHEETVAFTLATPPSGAPLLTGIADLNGFRHADPGSYPAENFSGAGLWETLGIDYFEADPNLVVRVGTSGGKNDKGGGGYSTDNGRTWTPFGDWPYGPAAKIAYSARDPDRLVALPVGESPKFSADRGGSWQDSRGAPAGAIAKFWHWNHPLAADRVDGDVFYLYAAGRFYRSDDGGASWKQGSALPNASHHYVEAAPGIEREVWVSLDWNGLLRSTDGGASFVPIASVERAYLFGFGKAAPGSGFPAIFLYGRLEGDDADRIYRSDDAGRSWIRIAKARQLVGNEPNIMRGDRQVHGRVYVGTNGRGFFCGEPVPSARTVD